LTPAVFFRKASARLRGYADRYSTAAARLPRRLLAAPVVGLLGPLAAGRRNAGREKRGKPHVLILRNKYYASNSSQVSTEVMHLDHTLAACGLATFDVLTYDHDLRISPLSDVQLIAKCRDIRPDAIILSSWWLAPTHPSLAALRFVREEMGIPVAAIWWDSCSKAFWPSLEPVRQAFDVHVILDNPNLHLVDRADPAFERILQLWPPQDESLFKPGASRDIPVSFLGQASAYRSYRTDTIDYLKAMNVEGRFSTSERGEQVTHELYAELMGRSRISLNFSYSVDCQQLKSRVMEVLFSGALLLESENEQTAQLFVPMQDYVPFSSKEDLVEKIRYYLEHEDELNRIAAHGRATALKHYGSARFWQLLLAKLKLIESK
jgi:hypothetical protein